MDEIFRIGIDHLIIKNIKLEYPENLKKITLTEEGSLQEGIVIKEEGFTVYSFTKLTEKNELIQGVNTLIFNPNKILDGNNLKNSTEKRIYDALIEVQKRLEIKGIEFDFIDSIVDTAEVNININIKFEELKKTLDLMFFTLSKGKSKCTYGDNTSFLLRNRRQVESFWFRKNENIYRAYNKTIELQDKLNIDIDLDITRIEDKISSHNFKKIFKENKLDTNIMTILNNFEIVENAFKKRWMVILKDSFKYLEETHAKEIEIEYRRFKDTQKRARERKKIDPDVKVIRGVYRYLYENFSIFDIKYLYEVIDNYYINNFKREKLLAYKYFSKENGLEKIEFLSNFF